MGTTAMKYSQKKSSENERLNQLREMLISVSDSYDYFVLGVIADCKRSKKKYPEKCSNITEQIIAYIEEHPKAKSSEIIEYTSNCCGLPWGDDEGVWHRWNEIITEEQAKQIVQSEYCDN